MEQVSIHAPAGGATYERAKYGAYTEGFNPRARGGRDGTLSCVSRFIAVSIHAPAGGATAECKLAMPLPFPFQSTRPRGARRTKCSTPLRLSKFQSTRPRGARPRRTCKNRRCFVSIHAPAGGATAIYICT